MSNIAKAFANGKAFIPFVTCGDPDLETTAKVVRAMAQAGADLIELGIPFSDPTAEGPVIQEANVRALAAGTTTDKIFDLVRDLRRDVTIPMVFMDKTIQNAIDGSCTPGLFPLVSIPTIVGCVGALLIIIAAIATPIAKTQHAREIWFYMMSGGAVLKIVTMEIARMIL